RACRASMCLRRAQQRTSVIEPRKACCEPRTTREQLGSKHVIAHVARASKNVVSLLKPRAHRKESKQRLNERHQRSGFVACGRPRPRGARIRQICADFDQCSHLFTAKKTAELSRERVCDVLAPS